MSYKIKLSVFEGPFDLLVYLIEHAQMSIYDIRISEITSQYMEYVKSLNEADINVASEFMVLAAELLEIKSKMLLPRVSADDGIAEAGDESCEDPRTELVERLREYKKFKLVSEMLEERFEETSAYLEKPQEDLTEYTKEPDEFLSLDLERFVVAFEAFLLRKQKLEDIKNHRMRTRKHRITNEKRIEDIKAFFREREKNTADFKELVHRRGDRLDIAVTFSSVLEMMKERRLDADQRRIYGNITIRATDYLFEEEQLVDGK